MEERSRLKEDLGAVILAHNYQPGPVQDLADLAQQGLRVIDPATRIVLHLGQIVRKYGFELIG